MKIKKVDDKPMVIHTKQKAKLHTHEPKQAAIKGSNVYTVDRDPTKKRADNGRYRKSTVHQVQKEGMSDWNTGRIVCWRHWYCKRIFEQ